MIELDHIAIWAKNHYATTIRLTQETGLGSYNHGYFPTYSLGQLIMPLCDDIYFEIEGIVDYTSVVDADPIAAAIVRQTRDADRFVGLCFRTDSMDELEAFAAHRGVEVAREIPGGIVLMSGQMAEDLPNTPLAIESWTIGKPNLYYEPDLTNHLARRAVTEGSGSTRGTGVPKIEVGGTESELQEWWGDVVNLRDLEVEIAYNGGPSGLYAVWVDTEDGTREVRMEPSRID